MLLVFRSYDLVTGNPAQPKSIILGVISKAGSVQLVKDWQVLKLLSTLASSIRSTTDTETPSNAVLPGERRILTQAEALLREAIPTLNLPFRQTELELLGIIGYAV